MTDKYINFQELSPEVKNLSKSAIRLYNVVKELNKEVDIEKEKLSKYTVQIKDYLVKTEYQGIDVNSDNLIYLQEMTRVPSFKQVLENIKDDLPKTVVKKLEQRYKDLTTSNGQCLKIK